MELDNTIHQPVRLQIMAALTTVDPGEKLEFTYLQKLLGVTEGNLGSHLAKLEAVAYIEVEKAFVNRKPRTFLSATGTGRDAFRKHIAALGQLIADFKSDTGAGTENAIERGEQ